MYTYHREDAALVPAPCDILFAHLDDHERLSSHMSRSSWMMAGSQMHIETDALAGRAVGSKIRLEGRVLGVPLSVDEVVVGREVPHSKGWQTVGDVHLLVIGAYRMGFEVAAQENDSRLRVFIDYDVPAGRMGRWIGHALGHLYARWCVHRMVHDAVDFFGRNQKPTRSAGVAERLKHVRLIVEFFLASLLLGACTTATPMLRPPVGHGDLRQAGVFLTPSDYDAGQLSHAVDCTSATQPVSSGAYAASDSIDLLGDPRESSRRISKATLFGFRACDGVEMRFVAGQNYRIVRAPPLYLYERQRRIWSGRISRLVTDHYFSVGPGDSLRPLTRRALKEAYPANHRFHDMIDLAFRSEDELLVYDDFHQEYRVSRLLRESQP